MLLIHIHGDLLQGIVIVQLYDKLYFCRKGIGKRIDPCKDGVRAGPLCLDLFVCNLIDSNLDRLLIVNYRHVLCKGHGRSSTVLFLFLIEKLKQKSVSFHRDLILICFHTHDVEIVFFLTIHKRQLISFRKILCVLMVGAGSKGECVCATLQVLMEFIIVIVEGFRRFVVQKALHCVVRIEYRDSYIFYHL